MTISVTENTPMEQVYVLFEMVRATVVFVVSDGGLKGMISRQRLLESLKSSNTSGKERRIPSIA